MRDIIKSLVLFVEEDQTGPLLENAEKQFGHQNLRLFSDEILDFLRSDLFVPRNKAIRYDNRPGWFSDFSLFVKNLGELNELFREGTFGRGGLPADVKIRYIAQVKINPPTFVMFSNMVAAKSPLLKLPRSSLCKASKRSSC